MKREPALASLFLSLVALGAGGCLPPLGGTIRIVSSLPMTGPVGHQGTTMRNAIEMAIDEADHRAGPFRIVYQPLDDGSENDAWLPDLERHNAEQAAQDADTCVYIGPYNSGAAQISIPILNQAHMVEISPSVSYLGLTQRSVYDAAGEPEKYYPTGVRTFCRLAPTDLLVGRAEAAWAATLGARSVYVVHAPDAFGGGLAAVFVDACWGHGLTILGTEAMSPDGVEACAHRVAATHPDLVFFGGISQNGAGQLLRRLRHMGCAARFMGPGGLRDSGFIIDAGQASKDAYCVLGAVPVPKLPPEAKEWQDRYVARYHDQPESYAIYSYEAARTALDGIARAGRKDRDAIRQAIMATRDHHGLLGTWSLDGNGDSSIDILSGYQVQRYQFEFIQVLRPLATH